MFLHCLFRVGHGFFYYREMDGIDDGRRYFDFTLKPFVSRFYLLPISASCNDSKKY